MCIGIIGGILSAGLSIMGAAAQAQAANDAAAAQNAYYMQNAAEAQRAARDSYVSQNIRLHQEKEAADQKTFEASVEALKKRGTVYNTAGEAGVSGLSVDALVGDIFAQEGRRQMSIDTQYKANRQDVLSQMDETRARAQARINSVQRSSGSSGASYMIQGLSGAVGAIGKSFGSGMGIG